MRVCVSVALAMLVSAMTAPRAFAFPAYARLAAEAYGRRFNCELCHGYGGGTERTVYGRAWQDHGADASSFRAIDKLDSDGDGTSNRAEIDAGSNPGDPRSTPAEPGRYAARISKTFVPTDQLELVFGHVDSIDAVDATLDAKQRGKIESAVGRGLSVTERLPTLYFAVRDGKRQAIGMFVHAERESREYAALVGMSAHGVIEKVALFHGEPKGGTTVRAYLDCMVGRDRGAFTAGAVLDCPAVAQAKVPRADLAALTSSVGASLWTVSTLLSKE